MMEWKAALSFYVSDLAITRPSTYPGTTCAHPDNYRKKLVTVYGYQCQRCRDIVVQKAVRYYE